MRFVLIVFKLVIFLDFVNACSDWRQLHVNPLRQQRAKNTNDLYVLNLTAFNWHQWVVTNSYGKPWDSSCGKSWVPTKNQWVPVQKNKESSWKCMGLYVTNWRQMPKLFTYSLLKLKYIPSIYLKHKQD